MNLNKVSTATSTPTYNFANEDSFIDNHEKHLVSILNDIDFIKNRLISIGERAFGPEPAVASESKLSEAPNGYVQRVSSLIESINGKITDCKYYLSRLDMIG